MSEFLKRQLDNKFGNNIPKFNQATLQKNIKVAPFSTAFGDLQTPPGKLKPAYREPFEKALAKMFITWYLNGSSMIVDGFMGIEGFLNSTWANSCSAG